MSDKEEISLTVPGFDASALSDPRSKYTPEEKLAAAFHYVLTGSIKKTAKETGIPIGTVASWYNNAPWWPQAVDYVKKQAAGELDAKLSHIVNITMDAIEDRVLNGDVVLDKTGTQVRVPVKGRELAIIAGVMMDKQKNLQQVDTSVTRISDEDRLNKMMDACIYVAKRAQEKDITPEE